MENMFFQYAYVPLLVIAVFFGLSFISGLMNLYLRYHEHLPIDREDKQALLKNAAFIVLFAAVTVVFGRMPFFEALIVLLCVIVGFQLFRVHNLVKRMEKQDRSF